MIKRNYKVHVREKKMVSNDNFPCIVYEVVLRCLPLLPTIYRIYKIQKRKVAQRRKVTKNI